MAWVTWRQHRMQLLGAGPCSGRDRLVAVASGGPMPRRTNARSWPRACRRRRAPGATSSCGTSRASTADRGARRALPRLPARPDRAVRRRAAGWRGSWSTARARLAWTQGVTRRRWLLSQTLLLALCERGRRARAERDRDVVAAPLRHPRGPDDAEPASRSRAWSCRRTRSSRSRSACSRRVAEAHGARRCRLALRGVRRRETRRRQVPAAALRLRRARRGAPA